MDINNLVTFMISLLLALSALLLVAEAVGFLPDRVSRWLNRNRLAQTISVLRELGLDIDRVKRRHIAMELVEHFQPASLPERVKTNLESLTFKKTVGVGSTEVVQAHQYIDLMGGTTNPAVATMFSRYLETFWRDRILASAADPTIDFVVTPKTGSPILGYEFARGVGLLFVMHSRDPKFRVQPDEFRAHFDCISQPPEGSRGLIIDDSTTGGDKILELLDDLQKFGYTAADCLIVFEPQLKEARRKLTDRGIRLHSVVKV